MNARSLMVLVGALTAAGCSSMSGGSDANEGGADSSTLDGRDVGVDALLFDAAAADGGADANAIDADASMTPGDGAATMEGQWRGTLFQQFSRPDSGLFFSATPTPTATPPDPVHYSINLHLSLQRTRLAVANALIADEHLFHDQPTSGSGLPRISASGAVTNGMLTPDGFVSGSTTENLRLMGASTLVWEGPYFRWVFERFVPGAGVSMLTPTSRVHHRPQDAVPTDMRLAIAWDRPMGGYRPVSDQALGFGSERFADSSHTVMAPPADVQLALGSTRVALAYALAYVDGNHSGALESDDPLDVIHWASEVAIAWRSADASPEFEASPYQDLREGLQYIAITRAAPSGAYVVTTTFDGPRAVPMDIQLFTMAPSRAIPDIVR